MKRQGTWPNWPLPETKVIRQHPVHLSHGGLHLLLANDSDLDNRTGNPYSSILTQAQLQIASSGTLKELKQTCVRLWTSRTKVKTFWFLFVSFKSIQTNKTGSYSVGPGWPGIHSIVYANLKFMTMFLLHTTAGVWITILRATWFFFFYKTGLGAQMLGAREYFVTSILSFHLHMISRDGLGSPGSLIYWDTWIAGYLCCLHFIYLTLHLHIHVCMSQWCGPPKSGMFDPHSPIAGVVGTYKPLIVDARNWIWVLWKSHWC